MTTRPGCFILYIMPVEHYLPPVDSAEQVARRGETTARLIASASTRDPAPRGGRTLADVLAESHSNKSGDDDDSDVVVVSESGVQVAASLIRALRSR